MNMRSSGMTLYLACHTRPDRCCPGRHALRSTGEPIERIGFLERPAERSTDHSGDEPHEPGRSKWNAQDLRPEEGEPTATTGEQQGGQRDCHDGQLPGLDSEVERKQNQWDLPARKCDVAERSSEAKSVNETEHEGHAP